MAKPPGPIFLSRTTLNTVHTPTTIELGHLSARERKLVLHLSRAAEAMDAVLWKQKYEHGLPTRRLIASALPYAKGRVRSAMETFLDHLEANQGPFYFHDQERKFIPAFSEADVRTAIARAPKGRQARLHSELARLSPIIFSPSVDPVRPPQGALYPPGTTKEAVTGFMAANPRKAASIGHRNTVLVATGRGGFRAVPYHVHYREDLEKVARHLERALGFADNRSLQRHLRDKIRVLRRGFRGNYDPSDRSWLKLDSKVGIMFGQGVETYIDDVLGTKGAANAFVYVKVPPNELTRRLERMRHLAPKLESMLPCDDAYKNRGHPVVPPIELTNAARIGGLGRGIFSLKAFTLPNDHRHGYKVVLLSNMEDAKGRHRLMPIARQILHKSVIDRFGEEQILSSIAFWTVAHEFSHGHGRYKEGDLEAAHKLIGRAWNPIEEAKADTVGLHDIGVMTDEGLLSARERDAVYEAGMVKWIERIQGGIGGAHSKASAMMLNYFIEKRAIVRDGGRYRTDPAKWRKAVNSLSRAWLTIEGEGNAKEAERMLKKYCRITPELARMQRMIRRVPQVIPEHAIAV